MPSRSGSPGAENNPIPLQLLIRKAGCKPRLCKPKPVGSQKRRACSSISCDPHLATCGKSQRGKARFLLYPTVSSNLGY